MKILNICYSTPDIGIGHLSRLRNIASSIIRKKKEIEISGLLSLKPSLYVCNVLSPKKIKPNKTNLLESLIEEKVKHLNLRLIKKLKKDSVIVLKKDFK